MHVLCSMRASTIKMVLIPPPSSSLFSTSLSFFHLSTYELLVKNKRAVTIPSTPTTQRTIPILCGCGPLYLS